MKKFQFPLDSVKNYKDQELEELKRLHGLVLVAIAQKQAEIEALETQYTAEAAEFEQKKAGGVTVLEAQGFDLHLRSLVKTIEAQHEALCKLQAEEEARRARVVEKRQEISSIEKLREKRVGEYNKALQKEEEVFIEEIVAGRRAAATG